MAGSVNKVILVGNLGREPEIRTTQQGSKIANLNIATSESWTDKQSGERKERTEWHRVVVFNENLVKLCENYLKKGSKIFVEGQLETRKWQDAATGADKYSTEIVLRQYRGELTMLDNRNGGGQGGDMGGSSFDQGQQSNASSNTSGGGWSAPAKSGQDFDDDIPF